MFVFFYAESANTPDGGGDGDDGGNYQNNVPPQTNQGIFFEKYFL